jgi:hypothetical protein
MALSHVEHFVPQFHGVRAELDTLALTWAAAKRALEVELALGLHPFQKRGADWRTFVAPK